MSDYDMPKVTRSANASMASAGQNLASCEPVETPDLHRINDRLGALIDFVANATKRLDANLERIGRNRIGSDATCQPCRPGVVGAISDKLDGLSSLFDDLDEIARIYDRIA